MSDHPPAFAWKVLFAVLTLLLLAGGAQAYVGPEADPATLGYFLSLVGWLLVALSSLLLWPVYAMIRFLRRGRAASSPPAIASTANPPEGTVPPTEPGASST